jgi:hypothetical protein
MSAIQFPSEQLVYTTVRLECVLKDGSTSQGTGFFFQFPLSDTQNIPVVVTNNHVVRGSMSLQFRLRARASDGWANNRDQIEFKLPYDELRWLKHPDPGVDLAALPIAGLLEEVMRQGKSPFFVSLREVDLPSEAAIGDLGAVENVLMIGYPRGLWDEFNVLPIVRAGITATHPAIDYAGRAEFMIDAACFEGSSGSPVFYSGGTSRLTRAGGTVMGAPLVYLLGVLYAGPMYQANGEIQIVEVPTVHKAIARSSIPMNLGLVIKARRILEFGPLLTRLAASNVSASPANKSQKAGELEKWP